MLSLNLNRILLNKILKEFRLKTEYVKKQSNLIVVNDVTKQVYIVFKLTRHINSRA